MHHKTICNGNTLIIMEPMQKLFMFSDESSARCVQLRLKDIDRKLEDFRLGLYRDAFGDGALGLTDKDLL